VSEQQENKKQKLARLQTERAKLEAERADKLLDREIEREELAARFEKELGPEGSEFLIYDSGHLGDPLVVVKRGQMVQYTSYEASKQTHADRYDFVSPCIVHPTLTEYQEARQRRYGIEIEVANRLAKLFGLRVQVDTGK
jgi:hypothetical protein